MLTGTLSPVSNKADWIDAYKLIDTDDDEPVDISDAEEITLCIRRQSDSSPVLTVTLNDGIEHIETGVFQWSFSKAQMGTLCAGTYEVGCTILKDGITAQLFIGFLPVIDGIVS